MSRMNVLTAALVAASVITCNGEEAKSEDAKPAETAAAPAKDPNEAVITVNGKKLTRGEVEADVARILESRQQQIPAGQVPMAKRYFSNQIAQEFVINTVLAAKAAEHGLTCSDEDLQKRFEELTEKVKGRPDVPKTLDEMLEKHPLGRERALESFKANVLIGRLIKAEAKDTEDYTAKAKEIIDDIVRKNESLKDSEATALARIKELKAELDKVPADQKAEKFAELAKANSACPSSAKGGDLGEFGHGQMVPEFDKAAFELEIGQISEPVKTQFGYHLVMTTGKTGDKVRASHILIKAEKPQKVPQLEQVVERLRKSGESMAAQKFVLEMLRQAEISAADDFKQILPPPAEQ